MGVSSVYVNCTCNFHFLDIVGERYNKSSMTTLRKNMVCCFLNKLSELGQFVSMFFIIPEIVPFLTLSE